jgi:hypothetical protein
MKANIEIIKNRIWINFSNLTKEESNYMEIFVNNSTNYVEDEKKNIRGFHSQFAGQGVIRYNGLRVRDSITENITFESPFPYNKSNKELTFTWKERLIILVKGKI